MVECRFLRSVQQGTAYALPLETRRDGDGVQACDARPFAEPHDRIAGLARAVERYARGCGLALDQGAGGTAGNAVATKCCFLDGGEIVDIGSVGLADRNRHEGSSRPRKNEEVRTGLAPLRRPAQMALSRFHWAEL